MSHAKTGHDRWRAGAAALSMTVALMLAGQGCGGPLSAPPASAPEKKPELEMSAPAQAPVKTALKSDYRYVPTNKPNPFRPFILVNTRLAAKESPLQRYDLGQLTLRAVIWQVEKPKAMVEDPTGRGHVVQVGTDIGKNRGKIVKIEDRQVHVQETYVDYTGHETTKDVTLRIVKTDLFGEES
ncbi:MAG: pilus assembly protein PilP [Planctomycetota bacterium]